MADEIIEITGWKGRGDLYIGERKDNYILRETRKSKETGEAYTDEHIIPKENVRTLLKIIKDNCDLQVEYKYKYLVRKVLEHYKFHEEEKCPIDIFMEAFNGGRNRSLYYFPYYYFPVKILEAIGKIAFFGRGGIMLLEQ